MATQEATSVPQQPRVIDLTPKQKRVYDFIVSFIGEHKYPPSLAQIAKRMRVKNAGGIVCHLEALEEKGLIHRVPGQSRTITVV